ncbi:MAG: YHS domain-containing protein [Myxococcales bacterium]|nr:YHS domain-containing protein [Myxococcales bacterium]
MSQEPVLGILFADLAGYTALTEAHGDDDAANVAERFYALTRQSLRGSTRFVKPIGDAVMLAGPEPAHLLDSLLCLRTAMEGEPDYPEMRAGIHLGPVVERSGDLFGSTVNVAARLAAYGRSGQVLCSRRFREALGERSDVLMVSLGAVRFKNVLEPIQAFEIVAAFGPPSVSQIDPVCRMRVDPMNDAFTSDVSGRTLRFCSAACQAAFLASPELYRVSGD